MSDYITAVGKTFPWHELYVPDAQKAKEFYVAALDWSAEDFDMGEMGKYPMFSANGSGVGGIMATSSHPDMANIPPHWAIYVGVDDVDARLAKCEALGAKCLVPPMDVPTVGRMCLIQDPQGATFWIFKSVNPA